MAAIQATRALLAAVAAALASACFGDASAQTLVTKMVNKHRQSVVYLKVQKTTNTGAVYDEVGTGVIVSAKGHVLTSCHVVDKQLRGDDGHVLPLAVDSVSILGAVASRAGQAEQLNFIACESPEIDVALLRFENTALPRLPVQVIPDQPDIGADLALMGFALNTEFYARPGTVSGEESQDRMLVSMDMNPGDSGGPVFDSKLNVVALGEAGYVGTRIGIVRPIRHAAMSLSRAGVNLFAYNAPLPSVPAADKPQGSNVFYAAKVSLSTIFGKPAAANPPPGGAQSLKITYPVFQTLPSATAATMAGQPAIDVKSIAAQPGYRIESAKYVISDLAGADVVHVGPSTDGKSVNAAIGKSSATSVEQGASPYVKGFIETVQVRTGP